MRLTAEDRDGDELPDAFDNCPDVPNIMQEDADGDAVGDACEAASDGASGGGADDDGCAVVAPRPVGVVGLLCWLLPVVFAYAQRRRRGSAASSWSQRGP